MGNGQESRRLESWPNPHDDFQMNPNREEALFALAVEKSVEKRAAFLDAMCDGDPALRARLDALLAAHEQPETLQATQAETARPTIKLDLTDAPDEAVGQTLGRYKLLERVGGFASTPYPSSGDRRRG